MSKAGSIYELATVLGNAKLIRAVGELTKELSDLNVSYAALQDENRELKERIRVLTEADENPLMYIHGAYHSKDGDGPFCTACYDNGKKTIRLTTIPATFRNLATHMCPVCKAPYTVKG